MNFTVRPLTPADYPRMVAILQAQIPNPPSVEELLAEDANPKPDVVRYRAAACNADGLMVGYGSIGRQPQNLPGHLVCNVRIDREWRGYGAGDAIYRHLLEFARQFGATALEATVREREPEDRGWAEHRGFVVKHHRYASKLDLRRWKPEAWRPYVERAEAAGIRFASLAALPQTPERFQQFMDAYWHLNRDTPGIESVQRPSLDHMIREVQNSPYWDPAGVLLGLDGDAWIAMAWLLKEKDGSYYHSFTGVDREYRRRGLATAMKVVAITYARAQGARVVRTHNDSTNAPMLAVNRKLGFQPEPGVFSLEKGL